MTTKIEELELTTRSYNVLKAEGIDTVEVLSLIPIKSLLLLPNCGKLSANEIISAVKKWKQEGRKLKASAEPTADKDHVRVCLSGQQDIDLRDYFAGKAMQALITGPERNEFNYDDTLNTAVSDRAYLIADAMLDARGEA